MGTAQAEADQGNDTGQDDRIIVRRGACGRPFFRAFFEKNLGETLDIIHHAETGVPMSRMVDKAILAMYGDRF